jgi:hypothetical protein
MDGLLMEVVRMLAVTATEVIAAAKWAHYFRRVWDSGGRMQRSLSNVRAREALLERLERLSPEARPRWGTMSAPQMLAHLVDWMRMAEGKLKTAPKNRPLRYPPIKQLAIYWLPFPKGVPTAPELVSRAPLEWAIEQDAVRQHVQSFGKLDSKFDWPDHPAFGKLTPQAWGVLGYRHMDHHLRQFGV